MKIHKMPELTINRRPYIEVPAFLLFFAFSLSDPVKANWLIFKTCHIILGHNKSECALLGTDQQSSNLEKLVQPYTAVITMVCSLVESFSSATFCLFVGPWTDKFGRKPFLLLPILGYLLYYLLVAILSLINEASPWFLLICYIPVIITGGFSSYLASLLCYITDLSTENDRGMRMTLFDASIFLGVFLGNVLSSFIFAATSYPVIFSSAGICCFLSLAFTFFLIPESLRSRESDTMTRFKTFFQISNIHDMVKITFRKRSNYARLTVVSCVIMTTIGTIVMNGNDSVMFLFLRERFQWPLRKYTLFLAISGLIYITGSVLAAYLLHKILKIPETVLILVALISSLNGSLVLATAKTEWSVYFASLVRILSGTFNPMVRCLVSKVVPNIEVGTIFALVTAGQFLFGIIGSPLYTFIYNETITKNVGFFNFVSAGFYMFLIFVSLAVIIVRTMLTSSEGEEGYRAIRDENEDEENVA